MREAFLKIYISAIAPFIQKRKERPDFQYVLTKNITTRTSDIILAFSNYY